MTGRYLRHAVLNHAFEVEDVVGMVRLDDGGHITFNRGNEELAPGITLHPASRPHLDGIVVRLDLPPNRLRTGEKHNG